MAGFVADIVAGLLWEFPLTVVLAVGLGSLAGYHFGMWAGLIGAALGIALGLMLDVRLWRLIAWPRRGWAKDAPIWAGAAVAALFLVVAFVVACTIR